MKEALLFTRILFFCHFLHLHATKYGCHIYIYLNILAGAFGFYFSQNVYNIVISSDLPARAHVAKIYVMEDLNTQEEIACTIISPPDGAAENASPSSYFAVHQHNYSIYLTLQIPGKNFIFKK